jgi:hypothetical protein
MAGETQMGNLFGVGVASGVWVGISSGINVITGTEVVRTGVASF